jgi:hypothetical protein
MKQNIFQDIRQAAVAVAVEFAEGQNLEVDLDSADLVRFPGEWRGLWVFNAVSVAGDLKQVSVMMEPSAKEGAREVRLMSPGIVRRVSLDGFKARVSKALAARPKSQGQTVSDTAYANWKAERGEREAFAAVVGCTGAPAPQPENWPAGRPFPHQAE